MRRDSEAENRFMARALDLAREGVRQGETPVGAVIVRNGAVIGSGYNRVEKDKDPTAHAEIMALREACRTTVDWRLPHAVLYVTLEPCIMCAAALIHARIERVVYALRDTRWGGLGTLFDLSHDPRLNHQLEVITGVMEEEAAELLQGFFRGLRNKGGAMGMQGNGQAAPEPP